MTSRGDMRIIITR